MNETNLPTLIEERDRLVAEVDELRAKHGTDLSTWTDGQMIRCDNLERSIERLGDNILVIQAERAAKVAERAEKVEAVRSAALGSSNREAGSNTSVAPVSTRSNPWDGLARAGSIDALDSETGLRTRAASAVEAFSELDDSAKEKLAAMLDDDKSADSARYVLALGNPAYRGAFENWIRSPQTAAMDSTPEELAAWRDVAQMRSAFTTSNASSLIPLVFDPVVHLTNVGSLSSVRQYANVQLTTTNQFRAVKSAGITAEWKVEGAEAADATPTLTGVDLSVYQGFASVMGSYEIFDDTNIASQLGGMFLDARVNQENEAFVTGSGSGAPWGFITRLAATTASRVATTTASSFTTAATADVFRLRDAVPARHRQSRGLVFAGNIAAASIIQQMSPSANGGSFWSNLNERVPDRLLGVPFVEATSMSSSTTGSSQAVLACVNLREYQIADRLGTTVEHNNVHGSNGRSTGQWEFTARWRTSGDLVNYDAGRVLRT